MVHTFLSALNFVSVTPSMGVLFPVLRKGKVSTLWSWFFLSFIFNLSHSDWREVESQGCFDLNYSPVLISSRLSPTFSYISFTVSGFMWSSLIHLDLTLVHGDKNGSIHILLHDNHHLCQHHLLKMLSFFHWMVLVPLSKMKWPEVCGFISASSIIFH